MSESKRLLCVEDEPEMIELIRLILERQGFEVLGALGGQEGLDAIRREKPDLVLLDLMMPDVDGWEVYRQMKADEELQQVPVIVVTSKAQSIDKVLGMHIAKVDDYITKPFGPGELVDAVQKTLAKHDADYRARKLRELQAAMRATVQELEELQDRDSEHNRAFYHVGMVTSSLIHDLRNYVALIKQSLGILANQIQAKDKLAYKLDEVESHHRYVTFLIDTLVELGLESGFRPVEMSARDLLVEASATIRHKLPPSLELNVQKPSGSLIVESDAAQARVALVSLLRFAMKATNIPGQIRVDVKESNSNVDFTISGQPASECEARAVERLVERIACRHGGALQMGFLVDDDSQECRLKIALSLPEHLPLADYVALTQSVEDVKSFREMLSEARSKVRRLRTTREQAESDGPLETARKLTTEYTHELEAEIIDMYRSLAECLVTPPSEKKIEHRLQRMNRHAHLARLLVATYRLLLQPQAAQVESVRLRPIVEELVRLVVLEKSTAIEVEVSLSEDLDWQVDPFLFEVMLFNLLTNTVQAMPQGGRLTVQAEATNSQLSIKIKDSGLGIDAENLPHLFELGFTTRRHGFGIGMTVISQIIQAHEGHINVESSPGQGTTINIVLPLTGMYV